MSRTDVRKVREQPSRRVGLFKFCECGRKVQVSDLYPTVHCSTCSRKKKIKGEIQW